MEPWKRHWWFYHSEFSYSAQGLKYSVHYKLGFVSYWLIRIIHGRQKLNDMSAETYLMREFGYQVGTKE